MRSVTLKELRNHFGAILREVQSGQSLIVTRNGTPIAELRPIQPRRFVTRATIARAVEQAPRIHAQRFRAEIDARMDQRVDG